jgi:hypothetical protein
VQVKRFVVASALALLALPGVAAAQPAPAPQPNANAKAAKDHFKAGERLIKQQKFAEAIAELEQAYNLDPQTEHLYNLGVAHHLQGGDAIAIEYYRLYLIDAPAGKTARDAAGYLSSLERKLVDAREKKIKEDLADAQAKAAREGTSQDTVELLLYAQYIADAEAKERKVQVIDDEIKANETEITVQKQRRETELGKARKAEAMAHKWERHARQAPTGAGRGRRVVGAILLSAGAAAVTMAAHDVLTRDPNAEIDDDADIYAAAGGISLLIGLVSTMWGEGASSDTRASTFERMHLVPTVGREGGGVGVLMSF